MTAGRRGNVIDMWNFAPRIMRILYVPCSDDHLYLGLMAPNEDAEAARTPIHLDTWAAMFPFFRTALERVAALPDARRDTYETRVLDTWSRGSVALVGDAAHAMCPALAQGAGCGMVNGFALATTLAAGLAASGSTAEALRVWEDTYRPVTDRCQSRSAWFAETRSMSRGAQFTPEILETADFDPTAVVREGAMV